MKFTVISIITGEFSSFLLYLALYLHQKVGSKRAIFTFVNSAVSIFSVGFHAA